MLSQGRDRRCHVLQRTLLYVVLGGVLNVQEAVTYRVLCFNVSTVERCAVTPGRCAVSTWYDRQGADVEPPLSMQREHAAPIHGIHDIHPEQYDTTTADHLVKVTRFRYVRQQRHKNSSASNHGKVSGGNTPRAAMDGMVRENVESWGWCPGMTPNGPHSSFYPG